MAVQFLPEKAVQNAFDWLLESSDQIAAAKGNQVRKEFKAKKVHARLFRTAEGTIEYRKAYATDGYIAAHSGW